MGQYRMSFYFRWKLGLSIEVEPDLNRLFLGLPFMDVYISWDKFAKGLRFFKD